MARSIEKYWKFRGLNSRACLARAYHGSRLRFGTGEIHLHKSDAGCLYAYVTLRHWAMQV